MGTIVATLSPTDAGIHLDITFAASVTKITVSRQGPGGVSSLIRYGDQIPTPGGHVAMDDFEAPLDVPVYYTAAQIEPPGSETATSNVVTIASGGHSWLKDPGYPSRNMRIPVVTSIASLTRPARSGVFSILDRVNPVVVTGQRQGPVGELVCHTLTENERLAMLDLVARGQTLLLQTPVVSGFGSRYISVGDVVEERVGVMAEQARRFTLPFLVVDRPQGLAAQAATTRTWQAVKDTYPTWGDLAGSGKTWQRLLEEGP